MPEPIVIRRADSPAEYRACQDAQRLTWGLGDESYVVPVATMIGAQLHGGLVLGAFTPDGRAVGMSFAFLGKVEGRSCLYSQVTGVIPGYRSLGLGRLLKFAQRDHCRDERIPTIAWAYDPFQPGNARFNLAILGASGRRYVRDMYGPRTDTLNAGSPTDRLIVEWDSDTEARANVGEVEWRNLPRLLAFPRPDRPYSSLPDGPYALLEIPLAMAALRRDDPSVAEHWRTVVAEAFEGGFELGYRAIGFVSNPTCGRGFYVMAKGGADTRAVAQIDPAIIAPPPIR